MTKRITKIIYYIISLLIVSAGIEREIFTREPTIFGIIWLTNAMILFIVFTHDITEWYQDLPD